MSTNPHTDEITLGRMKASYECGNIRGKHDAEKHARIAALAAIRRAARVARNCDTASKASLQDRRPDDAYAQRSSAHAIRYAIRAAIGSDKT